MFCTFSPLKSANELWDVLWLLDAYCYSSFKFIMDSRAWRKTSITYVSLIRQHRNVNSCCFVRALAQRLVSRQAELMFRCRTLPPPSTLLPMSLPLQHKTFDNKFSTEVKTRECQILPNISQTLVAFLFWF